MGINQVFTLIIEKKVPHYVSGDFFFFCTFQKFKMGERGGVWYYLLFNLHICIYKDHPCKIEEFVILEREERFKIFTRGRCKRFHIIYGSSYALSFE